MTNSKAIEFEVERESNGIQLVYKEVKGYDQACYLVLDNGVEYSMQFELNFAITDFDLLVLKSQTPSDRNTKVFKSLKDSELFYITRGKGTVKSLQRKCDESSMVGMEDGLWDSIDWFVDAHDDVEIELVPVEKQEMINKFLGLLNK